MQANLHTNTSNQFNNYSEHNVVVNQTTYAKNIIVTRSNVIDLELTSINDLTTNFVEELIKQHQPDIIIFGTGKTIIMPSPEILIHLQRQHIGFEVMSVPALCRTFNYLSGEDRNVVGLILF